MNTKQTSKYDSETGRKLSMGERYADAISQPVTDSGKAPRDIPRSFIFVEHKEVSESEFDDACEAAMNLVKIGRLRAYLRPILTQQAKNVAQAAANGISDFEAMKRGREMLSRIENEVA